MHREAQNRFHNLQQECVACLQDMPLAIDLKLLTRCVKVYSARQGLMTPLHAGHCFTLHWKDLVAAERTPIQKNLRPHIRIDLSIKTSLKTGPCMCSFHNCQSFCLTLHSVSHGMLNLAVRFGRASQTYDPCKTARSLFRPQTRTGIPVSKIVFDAEA